MIKAVIFDLDNTLYDYDSCNALAEKKLFEEIASEFDISEEQADRLLKKSKSNIKKVLGRNTAASHNRLLYMQNLCEQLGKNPLLYATKFYNVYWDTLLENMVLYEYVKPLLKNLRERNIKSGILTDLTAYIQYRKIYRLGIMEEIKYLVTSEEAGCEKPSEKPFLLMLEKMNLMPEEALMIGDSKSKDVDGAMHVGMKAIQFNTDNPEIDICREIIERIKNEKLF